MPWLRKRIDSLPVVIVSNDQFPYFSASLTCFDAVKDAIVSGRTLRPLTQRTRYCLRNCDQDILKSE